MNVRRNSGRFLDALRAWALLAVAAGASLLAWPAAAQTEQDLPGRVGRVAEVGGELYLASQDKPDTWMPAGLNYPVATGDNLWAGADSRAEIDIGGSQFRMAGDTSVHVSQLDERRFALFVAQGRVSVRVGAVEGGDVMLVDTPNAQIAITRPGLYRIDVSQDRLHTLVAVREGEVNVQTLGAVQQVLPGQGAYVDGADPQYANVQNGIALDGFDSWVASRDRLYRVRGNTYVSPQMVGAADLDQYGSWQQSPEYGAVWYPNNVASDWAPYRNGYWVDVGGWGPTWVDAAPWGYAPFHYGRWAFIGGRWGWTPGVYAARPLWAPALVAWTGGSGWSVSATVGGPVYGWVPLAWGEPFRPWWGRCSAGCWDRFNRPYAVNVAVIRPSSPPPHQWRNASAPGGVTAVPFQAFQSRQPVSQNLVRVSRDSMAAAPVLAAPPVFRGDAGRTVQPRPGGAPPAASSVQSSFARPLQVAPANAAVPASRDGGASGDLNRTRPGLTPSAPSSAPGAPVRQAVPVTPSPGYAQPTPSSGTRDARPGTVAPQGTFTPQAPASSAAQPVNRVPQAGVTVPVPQSAAPSPSPLRPQQQVTPNVPNAMPLQRQPQGAAPVPSMPQASPAPQPSLRVQPQTLPQAAPQQPMVRPQPTVPVPQAGAPMPQAAPSPQPVNRAQPPAAPAAAPQHAPASRGQPADAPEPARPGGTDSGNLTRGAR